MIFCTYCGKSFTRKEHLERHIPSHTNVKPHRCTLCQLSFPRKDLLQRHHFTYHEEKDSMQPVSGGVPPLPGRAPIACMNCASAKTGCDKRVPCSRCAEKGLPCEARFARRSGKVGSRATSFSGPIQPRQQQNDFMNVEILPPKDVKEIENAPQPKSPPRASPTRSSRSPQKPPEYTVPSPQFVTPTFSSPPMMSFRGSDTFMPFNDNDILNGEATYQDLMMWNQFTPEMEIYPNGSGPEMHQNMIMSCISPDFNETPSGSECMVNTSRNTSLSNSITHSHTRSTSIATQADFERPFKMVKLSGPAAIDVAIPEFEVVVAAEAAWPLARCNPPMFSGQCPRTAIVHLENLEQHSKHESTWKLLDQNIAATELDPKGGVTVVPLTSASRDRILAITQTFLHTALETHRGGMKGWNRPASPDGGFKFLVLPPSSVLEYFLRNFVRSLAPYYTMIQGGVLDPNELMLNNQAATLLLLLMIAQGATALPTAEARCLTAGLTETCRISLFGIIEKDVELSADAVVLRCALLFTILGAWSGDAWHINIAMGQRGMYLAMLKHAGMLEPAIPISVLGGSVNAELQWRTWQQQENRSRLVYNWVMVDQELSLFHDTAPVLSITELETPVPSPEPLWLASSTAEWLAALNGNEWGSSHSSTYPPLTPSLCDLFQDMLHDNIGMRYGQLSPLQLKLLLHPLQSLLCHLRQILSCFSDFFGSRRGTRTVTKASTLLRLEEVQSLLQKWYELCSIHAKETPQCPITRANLVLYHLISLNALTSFPEIERLARKDGFNGSSRELALRYKRCVHQPEEATVHCGQVLRLVCAMPREGRPHWWAAAVYRATLILWVDSLARQYQSGQEMQKGPVFAIDRVTPDDPAAVRFLWNGEGIPVLSKPDGGHVELRPGDVLDHCISLLDYGVALRFPDGIRRKLQTLRASWGSVKEFVHDN